MYFPKLHYFGFLDHCDLGGSQIAKSLSYDAKKLNDVSISKDTNKFMMILKSLTCQVLATNI